HPQTPEVPARPQRPSHPDGGTRPTRHADLANHRPAVGALSTGRYDGANRGRGGVRGGGLGPGPPPGRRGHGPAHHPPHPGRTKRLLPRHPALAVLPAHHNPVAAAVELATLAELSTMGRVVHRRREICRGARSWGGRLTLGRLAPFGRAGPALAP